MRMVVPSASFDIGVDKDSSCCGLALLVIGNSVHRLDTSSFFTSIDWPVSIAQADREYLSISLVEDILVSVLVLVVLVLVLLLMLQVLSLLLSLLLLKLADGTCTDPPVSAFVFDIASRYEVILLEPSSNVSITKLTL